MLLDKTVHEVPLHVDVHITDEHKDVFLPRRDRRKAEECGLILQVLVFLLEAPDLLKEVPYAVADLVTAAVRQVRDLLDALLVPLREFERPSSARDEQTHPAVKLHDPHYFDEADLARPFYMGRAAGAEVHPGDLHKARLAFDLYLAPVDVLRQFPVGRIQDLHRHISVYDLVGLPLELQEPLLVQLAVHVDRYRVVAQVESDIVKSVKVVHETGQNMLAGMVLHKRKSAFPVDPKRYAIARFERRDLRSTAFCNFPGTAFCGFPGAASGKRFCRIIRSILKGRRSDRMPDHAVRDLHIDHPENASAFPTCFFAVTRIIRAAEDPSRIRRLAAALREKDRTVQDHFPRGTARAGRSGCCRTARFRRCCAVFCLPCRAINSAHREDFRLAPGQVRVFLIQLNSLFHIRHSLVPPFPLPSSNRR